MQWELLIVSKVLELVQWAKDCIKDAFDARDLGEAKLYLGMTIERGKASTSRSPLVMLALWERDAC